ncbi:MAG: 5-oxoprolinase subunit PxpA [Propionibacteriaceae bacterium]|nr:5-oxoprolinase subunit PxpA [Propionibacteriaceae bacterium]
MHIDLNADLGEGCGDDAAMLDVVSSANVACGGHAGDRVSMLATSDLARRRRVRIGAHPSYEDRANFGRLALAVESAELERQMIRQLRSLANEAVRVGSRISYVKPHGALYHAVASDAAHASAVVAAISKWSPGLPVLGAPQSLFLRLAAEAGLPTVAEGFADRAYDPSGALVPRARAGAVLHDVDQVVEQAVLMATERRVRTIDGTVVDMGIDSICLHGDTVGAVRLATAVRRGLEAAGVRVVAFA